MTIPWLNIQDKTYHDILIDHSVKVPLILEKFDALRSSSASGTNHALVLLMQECRDLKDTLTTWENRKKQLSRPVLIKYERGSGDIYPFEHEMSWENHLFLNASLVYWSVQLVLTMTLSQIELFLASIGFTNANTFASTTKYQQEARKFATCIVQSIPYCLMPDMGALGISHINFPMCLAFAHFTQSNEKQICAWLMKVCEDMRQQGIRIRSFDDASAANRQRDMHFPGSPSTDSVNDALTGVALIKESERDEKNRKWPAKPSSTPNGGNFITTFIYENPARYYIDTSLSIEPT